MKDVLYSRYPARSVIIYNGLTILHFLLGAAIFVVAYGNWLGYALGAAYLVFAVIEMYLLMPLKVCPSCPYYRLENSLCISGMSTFSRKIARPGQISDFGKRAIGAFCPNNLYLAGLVIPIIGAIPSFFLNFSWTVLCLFMVLLGLLLFRFFVVFPRIACNHCRAKNICPNARSMGLSAPTR